MRANPMSGVPAISAWLSERLLGGRLSHVWAGISCPLTGSLAGRLHGAEELRVERRQNDERLRHLHARAADLRRGVAAGSLVAPKSFQPAAARPALASAAEQMARPALLVKRLRSSTSP